MPAAQRATRRASMAATGMQREEGGRRVSGRAQVDDERRARPGVASCALFPAPAHARHPPAVPPGDIVRPPEALGAALPPPHK